MIENFPFYLSLIIAIVLLIMLANKIKVAYPVLLVVAGLLISFIPNIPVIRIDPELIFIIFLPPLLYEAAWAISWKELWKWRRIISSFAFVVVFLTATTVAFIANHFIPGFSLALGFLLGGIVSPPDAVSAGAILKFVKVPKRMTSILEGESLLNDASSLIIFRFAMIAVATGQFIWHDAVLSFSWMLIGGIGIGLLIGWLFMKGQKILPTDANMDTILTIVAPYVMYITAEEFHSSGVLAVVSGALLLSTNRNNFLSTSSRLRGINVWESLAFVLNGLVFILIGLDLPEITADLEGVSISAAIGYGLLITLVLVVVRLVSAYGAVIITLIARNYIPVADTRNPGYKIPALLGWTGMRGVVSLAAALSIPVKLYEGGPDFPQRNLILFITFIVILTTLLVQGLTLPYLIKKMNMPSFNDHLPDDEAEDMIRHEMAKLTLQHLTDNYSELLEKSSFLQQIHEKWRGKMDEDSDVKLSSETKTAYLDILNAQRAWLIAQNHDKKQHFDEDLIRKHLMKIDLEEERILLVH
ncbi:CPA1 family monovalent cation:H+ antiporter [Chryseobacterium ginsenosidimutans]|jgi:CPA1 family monovalent cation:H+ antiporter|uniref:Na+/H+ antiporter n=1 Tax=Chryseobacterium ginsenosidimutans TaxID=687846 RepID=UPI002167115C|nr:Na+/H+ antiporter [Chryseobacterium ginsenosidimutans]MCS3869620.1 CPA1 family monovalent cation:H+ antiporter [Chryseobacterium ginsenosidimutans]